MEYSKIIKEDEMYLVDDIERYECLYKEAEGSLKNFYKHKIQQILWSMVGSLREVVKAARDCSKVKI